MSLTQINKAGLDEIALDHVFTIGASGSSAYTFQGEGLNGTVNNPTLYLTRGKTYRFENGSGGHPIRIQSTSGASGTAYNTGVTNNAGSGTVIVEVQHDAPDVLYYQCTSHAAMNGILYITGALADGGVTTAKIANGAVTNSKIDAGAVTTASLGTNAVTTSKILDGNVTAVKLASGITDLVADTSPQLGGNLDTNGKVITFGDSSGSTDDRLRFGNGDDLQIYHDGSHSYIDNSGTGHLYIKDTGIVKIISDSFKVDNSDETKQLIKTTSDAVELFQNNSKKFETTSSGATVTGSLTVTNDITLQDNLLMGDTDKIRLGDSQDLEIYHDGSNSFIKDGGTGALIAQTSTFAVNNAAGTEQMMKAVENGAVELNYDGGLRLSTESSQVTIHRHNTFPNPNNTGAEITGATLDIGGNLHLEERYPNGAYADRQDLVLRTNTGYGQGLNDKVRFSSSGSIFLEVAGSGISFEPHGASNVNLLDDYEEGTWTPDARDGSLSFERANYTKIGRMVYLSAYVYNFSDTSTNDSVTIQGLPFSPSVISVAVGSVMYQLVSDTHNCTVYLASTGLVFYGGESGGYNQVRYNELQSSSSFYFQACYFSS